MSLLFGPRRALVSSGKSFLLPSDLSGLAMWIAADRITGAVDGDPVTTWSDLSGNGRHLTQATASKKPTYKTAIQNGLPVVRGDGVDDDISTTLPASSSWTFTGVMRMVSHNAAYVRLWGFGDSSQTMIYDVNPGFGFYQVQDTSAYQLGGTSANFSVVTLSLNSNTSAYVVINGVTSLTFDPWDFSSVTAFSLFTNGTGGLYWGNADMAEFIAYTPALSATDRARVEAYLTAKWAIS